MKFHRAVHAIAVLSIVFSICAGLKSRGAAPEAGGGKRLVGMWLPKDSKQAITFLAGGRGKNPNGDRFTWRVAGSYLVSQRIAANGKPQGAPMKLPVVFTRDGKEFSMVLEGGNRRAPFYRLLPNGKVDSHRSREGGTYPPDKFSPKPLDDDDSPPPTTVPGAPGNPTQVPGGAVPGKKGGDSTGTNLPRATSKVGPNVQVSAELPGVAHSEVTIAAHPHNPDWLLAASMYTVPDHPATPKLVVYASLDGGRSWSISLHRNQADPCSFADPAFVWADDGTAYFTDIRFATPGDLKTVSIEFAATSDGGRTWSERARIAGPHDRPFTAVGGLPGEKPARIYCTMGIPARKVFISTDSAGSFTPAGRYDTHMEGMLSGNPVVTANGSLLHLYESFSGDSSIGADPDRQQSIPGGGQTRIPVAVKIARSTDGGASFKPSQTIATFSGPSGAMSGLPMLAADSGSKEYKGHAYAVWAEEHPRGSRVMAAVSQDNGVTWLPPVILSEQTEKRSYPIFLPTVAVNREGVVGVSWYDTRDIPLDQAGWDIRFRASTDGGRTWLPSIRVNSVTTLNLKKRRKRPNPATRFNNIMPGHTAGITADANGTFRALWIDNRTGVLQVWTAPVVVK